MLGHLLQSGVSTIQKLSYQTYLHEHHHGNHYEGTSPLWLEEDETTKGRPWTIPPLHLKATTPPIPLLSTMGRTSSVTTRPGKYRTIT
jgi:hypothetical protein